MIEKLKIPSINLKQFLALPVAFAIGWGIAFPFAQKVIHYDWSQARNEVKSLESLVDRRFVTEPNFTTDALRRWLTNSVIPGDPKVVWQTPSPSSDPWGNEYQFSRRVREDGERSYGVYSLGRDGVTTSIGNDPDDINSWSIDPVAFYMSEPQDDMRMRRMYWTIPGFFIVYLPLFYLLRSRTIGGATR